MLHTLNRSSYNIKHLNTTCNSQRVTSYTVYTVEIKLETKACGRLWLSLDMVLSGDEDN